MNCDPSNDAAPATAAAVRRQARDAALARLLEARSEFATCMDERYANGARVAARDSDRLEAIAARILGVVDDLQPAFDRLDVGRDLCAYQGPAGLRVERSVWDRPAVAGAIAEAFEILLHPSASAVLASAVRLELSS